jgi:hypothetical protein
MQNKNQWYLLYYTDIVLLYKKDMPYYKIFAGGSPIKDASFTNARLKKLGWKIPKSLKEFYNIHNGFGNLATDSIWWADCVVPMDKLNDLGELMNPIAKEQNDFPKDYAYNDLLEFYPDGAGNTQCFNRYGLDKNQDDIPTCDWDHETREVGGSEDFWEFLDERLNYFDEE